MMSDNYFHVYRVVSACIRPIWRVNQSFLFVVDQRSQLLSIHSADDFCFCHSSADNDLDDEPLEYASVRLRVQFFSFNFLQKVI